MHLLSYWTPKKPNESKATPDVIPSNVSCKNIITHNVPEKSDRTLRKRPVVVPNKVTERKSNRKHQNVDYSKLDASTEEPSPPPPHKCRKPNLLCKPSKTVLEAHKKRKMLLPLFTGKTVTMTKETSVHVPRTEAKASTSTSTARTSTSTLTMTEAETPAIGIVTVKASQEETETTIAVLLSLGRDIPPPAEDLTAENAALVPINPNITDTNSAHKSTAPTPNKDPPEVKPAAVPVH